VKHSVESHSYRCGCRSVGECTHNLYAETEALSALVDDFAKAMKEKLRKRWSEGRTGWDDPNWTVEDMKKQLIEHVDKGDPVDIANFAAFIWNRHE
jgi:hypothetical protein